MFNWDPPQNEIGDGEIKNSRFFKPLEVTEKMHKPPNSGPKESFDECIDILQQLIEWKSKF